MLALENIDVNAVSSLREFKERLTHNLWLRQLLIYNPQKAVDKDTMTFQMDDGRLNVPTRVCKRLNAVIEIGDQFRSNQEPLTVTGFDKGTMYDLISYVENGELPKKAEDIVKVVKLAFHLQLKDEEQICAAILRKSRLKAEARKVLQILSVEENTTILECMFLKSGYENALDEFYEKQVFNNQWILKNAIRKVATVLLGESEEVQRLTNKYLSFAFSTLRIPEDLLGYGEGMNLPDSIGHLIISGDLQTIMKGLDRKLAAKLELELINLKFSNLIVLDYSVIPSFLKEKRKSDGDAMMKRDIDRLWIDFASANDIRLPVVVKRVTCLCRLDCYASDLDFSQSEHLTLRICKKIFIFNEDSFKYTDTLKVRLCLSVDLTNAIIGPTLKHLDFLSDPIKRVYLPKTIQPGLRTLKLKMYNSDRDDPVLNLTRWNFEALEVLEVYYDRPDLIVFSEDIYKIHGLKILGTSYNLFDLTDRCRSCWNNLETLSLRNCWGEVKLPYCSQLRFLHVRECGLQWVDEKLKEQKALVLSSSAVEGVELIEVTNSKGPVVFPESVERSLGRIHLRGVSFPIFLPQTVKGVIEELYISNCPIVESKELYFPTSLGNNVILLKVANHDISVPEYFFHHTQELVIINCTVTLCELKDPRVSMLAYLKLDSGSICLKGWYLPNLERVCGSFQRLSLPKVKCMPDLTQLGINLVGQGELLIEGICGPLKISRFRKMLQPGDIEIYNFLTKYYNLSFKRKREIATVSYHERP